MILKNKYNEIMDRVKVDAAMRERVLRALEQEESGTEPGAAEGMEVNRQDAERAEPGIDRRETERSEIKYGNREAGETGSDAKEARDSEDRYDRKDEESGNGKKRLSFFGRMNAFTTVAAAVAALVLIGSGYMLVTRPSNNAMMGSTGMAEDIAVDMANDAEVAEGETAEGTEGGTTAGGAPGENIIGEPAASELAEEAAGDEAAVKTAGSSEKNAQSEEATDRTAGVEANHEITVGQMIDMVSGNASDHVADMNKTQTSTSYKAKLNGHEGKISLMWEKDIIERAVWTESGSDVSFSELAISITEATGQNPVEVDAAGMKTKGSSEAARMRRGDVAYVWSIEGRTILLFQDKTVEVYFS